MATGKTYSILDIGTSQVTCIIGNVNDGRVNIQAIAVHKSAGIKKGQIVDMRMVEQSIVQAVAKVETILGKNITSLTASISGLMPMSHWFTEKMTLPLKKITGKDVAKLLNNCKKKISDDSAPLIHITPYFYTAGAAESISPIGIVANNLNGSIHMTTCDLGSLQNLKTLLDRCSISTTQVVIDSYASALGVMDTTERDMNIVVVDIGAGTSSICVFYKGVFIYSKTIKMGGDNITNDIMSELAVPLSEAERLKIKFGSALENDSLLSPSPIEYYRAGETDGTIHEISSSALNLIVSSRIEEIFDLVKVELKDFDFAKRLILTGGTANMRNIKELAEIKLKRKVRIGIPKNTTGLGEIYNTAQSSTAVGLLRYAATKRPLEEINLITNPQVYEGNLLYRIFMWFKNELTV